MRNSKPVRFFDFSGGLNTKAPVTALQNNQALDLQNLNLLPSGGFEKRQGNTAFNSAAMSSGAANTGLKYFRKSDGSEWLVTICGTKIYKSEFDGTMDDITSALTITTGANNIWTAVTMNDLVIFVGGNQATDVPIKWSGSGNAAALGGTPPVGLFTIQANNRLFIGNTVANPSRINWSTLGNPEDWSGAGSGSQDVSTNDGDVLIGATQIGPDHLLLFKQNSIHDMVIRSSPFPLFPLFRNVGACSPKAIVDVDGEAYFLTPEPRMKSTDGTKITDYPDTIDDVWDSLNKLRLPYAHGIYYKKKKQIMWFVSKTSTTDHDYCIIWDLNRKCWLRHPTGYKMNTAAIMKDRDLYAGAYDGIVYQQDVADTNSDSSEGAAINAYWLTGWSDMGSMIQIKNIPYIDVNFTTQITGTLDFGYAYDFASQTTNTSISVTSPGGLWGLFSWGGGAWGIQTDRSKLIFTKGRGKFIQFFIRNNNDEPMSFNGFEVPIKVNAPSA